MSNYLNLADVGAQTTGGKHMSGLGDDGGGEAKRNQANIEAGYAHHKGMSGSRMQEVGAGISTNIALMSKDMFDQAVRAVKGESYAIQEDEEGFQGLATPLADNENAGTMLRPGINA